MKLLLVEDEPVLVEEMEQYFRSHDLDVTTRNELQEDHPLFSVHDF